MAKRLTLKDYQSESRLFKFRVMLFAVTCGFMTLLLIGRLAQLQIIQNRHYTTLSNKNQLAFIPIEANRGLIYDRNGVLIAENVPTFTLDIVPDRVSNLNKTLNELQALFSIDEETINLFHKHRKQHRAFEPVPLKLKLNDEEVAKFHVNQHKFPGVMVNARMMRHYPLGPDLVNVIGYVGRINEVELKKLDRTDYSASSHIGKVGIERYYETILHGKVGYDQVEVNASGQVVRTVEHHPPTPGENLHLSIDAHLQQVAHQALKGERGAVVALDPKTGEVLALVSHPSYDPNQFINGISSKDFNKLQSSKDKPLYNRALRGQYPLASTIKPFVALKGLHLELIDPDAYIDDPGQFQLPNNDHVYKDWNSGGHGMVNLRKALIVSCDTYFYELSMKLGIRKMADVLDEFGFGHLTGVDILEELPGNVPTPEWKLRTQHARWYTGDTIISGIGQGYMLATPLQLASSAATLANRGLRYQPHILHNSIDPKGHITQSPILPEAHINFKSEHWDTVIDAMRGVVHSTKPSGTGRRFGRTPPYEVAAKTGTAEIYRPKRYENKKDHEIPKRYRDHSLFIAFAPIKDPKIAVSVVVENNPIAPKIARQVMDGYLVKKKKEA